MLPFMDSLNYGSQAIIECEFLKRTLEEGLMWGCTAKGFIKKGEVSQPSIFSLSLLYRDF